MKKADLIEQLEGAKALSSQVDIDKVIALIQQMDPEVRVEKVLGMSQELADELAEKIERSLDHNSNRFIDFDSAEFELSFRNEIELTSADVDVREIMDHVTASIEAFIIEEDEDVPAETDEFIEAQIEAEEDVVVTEDGIEVQQEQAEE